MVRRTPPRNEILSTWVDHDNWSNACHCIEDSAGDRSHNGNDPEAMKFSSTPDFKGQAG
jgi:hypothetical protein